MYPFTFADGVDVCVYRDGEIVKYRSKFIENYKEAAYSVECSRNWKHSG